MDKDDDSTIILKWYLCFSLLLFGGGAISSGISRYLELIETKQAMENGYIQQIDPTTHKPIWIKENNNECT